MRSATVFNHLRSRTPTVIKCYIRTTCSFMKLFAPLALAQSRWSLFAVGLLAVIFAGCTNTQPACIDESTLGLVKQAVEKSLAKALKDADKDAALFERVKQRIQIAVTTIRTANKDEKIGKVTCDATLEITIANPAQVTADPSFKTLQKSGRIPASLDTSGATWKTDIRYTAQHTEDTKHLLVELSGHDNMVNLLSAVGKAGLLDSTKPPEAFPSDLLAAGSAHDAAVRLLNHVYGKKADKHGCWMTKVVDTPFCMQMIQSDFKITAGGKRLYAIANGQAVDERGEAITSHAMQGLVGAFIVGESNGKAALVAQSSNLKTGTDGAAPPEWTLMELGANSNWGWQGEFHDCHQGYCGIRMIILANVDGVIEQLGNVPTEYDDTGACNEDDCSQKEATLESVVRVGALPKDTAFFNLLVTVSGSSNGKAVEAKTWTLPFNRAKHKYTIPEDWPYAGRDF